MIVIKNVEPKDLVVSFEGLDYQLLKNVPLLVDEKLVEHLQERMPLAFEFDVKPGKDVQIAKPKTTRTHSYLTPQASPTQDMRVTKAGRSEATYNPDEETNNSEFYGAGIEEDKP